LMTDSISSGYHAMPLAQDPIENLMSGVTIAG